jgi:hypothetical protein
MPRRLPPAVPIPHQRLRESPLWSGMPRPRSRRRSQTREFAACPPHRPTLQAVWSRKTWTPPYCVCQSYVKCRDFSDGWKPPSSFPPRGREKPIRPQGCSCGIFVCCFATRARAQHLSLWRKIEANWPASITDNAIERRRRLAASTPGSLRKERPWDGSAARNR